MVGHDALTLPEITVVKNALWSNELTNLPGTRLRSNVGLPSKRMASVASEIRYLQWTKALERFPMANAPEWM